MSSGLYSQLRPVISQLADDISSTNERLDNVVSDASALKDSVVFPYEYSDIEQGGVTANGINNVSASRIRTEGFISVIPSGKIYVGYDATRDDIYCAVSFYAINDFSVSRLLGSDWALSGAEFDVPENAKYCRIIWKQGTAGSANILPEAISNVVIKCRMNDTIEYVRSESAKTDGNFAISVPVKVGTLNSSGIESTNTTIRLVSDGFLPVTPGSTFSLSWDSDLTLQYSASFYTDADYDLPRTSASAYVIKGASITVPEGVRFARFLWRVGTAGTADLPLSSLTNVTMQPLSITDIIRSRFAKTRQYAKSEFFGRIDLDITYVGDLSRQQAFCRYNGKWYSVDTEGITVQANDLTVESSATLALGHANAMHTGSAHPEYAYVSGWNDNKVYVVDLANLAIVNTIDLPTTGWTSAAIDDVNGIAYIFQRDTYPNSNVNYNFIAYDYLNNQTLYSRKTARSFGAMQACDIWEDKIVVANGLGKASQIYDYRIAYNRQGDIVQEFFVPQLDGREPEGIMIDRDTGDIWFGVQIVGAGQQLYKLSAHSVS